MLVGIFFKTCTCALILILGFISYCVNAKDLYDNNPATNAEVKPKSITIPSPPNTVKGLIENGKIGDYALLRGYFYSKISDEVYEFHDDDGSPINLLLVGNLKNENFYKNHQYFVWGKIKSISSSSALFEVLSVKMTPLVRKN